MMNDQQLGYRMTLVMYNMPSLVVQNAPLESNALLMHFAMTHM
jgi:hypothetical protein